MQNRRWIAILLCADLCVSLPRHSLAQTDLSGFHVGPSKGEVIGAIIGAAAVTGLVVYLVVPKQKTIEGCLYSGSEGLQLTSADGKHIYVLKTAGSNLQPGRRVILKGKPGKKHGKVREFEVRKMLKDESACAEPSHAAILPIHIWATNQRKSVSTSEDGP